MQGELVEERKKIQELELCLAVKKVKISGRRLKSKQGRIGSQRCRGLANLKAQPRGRYVESFKGEVTFEEEAKYWKKRWKQAEQVCGEIAGRVKTSWRGVYEREEVDRRMKKGKPSGKDKGV